jgi:triacylglycerol esterase/lipase EstA (alpha/beta hydrolase family)
MRRLCVVPRRFRQVVTPLLRLIGIAAAAAVVSVAAAPQAMAAPEEPDTAVPAGANDFRCTPSAAHPRPVILVHGTGMNMATTWKELSPALKAQGYCVFALNYGTHVPGTARNLSNTVGGGSIADSAQELAAFAARVRAATHASKVDMVGHSQGALVIRQYLKFLGGTDRLDPRKNSVATMVSLAGTNHGSTFNLNETLAAIADSLGIPIVQLASATIGPSYIQQMVGSPFLVNLNAGGDTQPGVRYVAVGTRTDGIVTPASRTFLHGGPGATVRNVWVQDGCPGLKVKHAEITSDPRAMGIVFGALDPGYGRTHPLPCS